MDKTAKCFELRTDDGKLLADLRLYDIQIVEKENGTERRNRSPPEWRQWQRRQHDRGPAAQALPAPRRAWDLEGEKALARLKELFRVNNLKEVRKVRGQRR